MNTPTAQSQGWVRRVNTYEKSNDRIWDKARGNQDVSSGCGDEEERRTSGCGLRDRPAQTDA